MEQSETAAVARQLDFAASCKASATTNANGKGNSILPEHPQAQLQSKLLALAPSRQFHASSRLPQQVAQTKIRSSGPKRIRSQSKSPPREIASTGRQKKSLPILLPRAHPVKLVSLPKSALQPLQNAESPKTRVLCHLDMKDCTPKKQKHCNCKNSRCLKMYCECFTSGIYCDGCSCIGCHNKIEYEANRKASIYAILERNPNAFMPKIAISPHGASDVEHYKGCNCKKSGCLKKYCECFQANILCSDKCKCMDCKNFDGSEERKALFHGIPANSATVIQQVTNAAIRTPPSKKSKNQRMLFRVTLNDQLTSRLRQFSQETRLASDASYPPLSSIHLSKPDSATTLGPTFYRSSLAGMIQSHHVKDLCALLIKDSAEAARTFTEKTTITNDEGVNEAKIYVVSSHIDHKDNRNLDGNQEDGVRTSSGESAGSAIDNRRPFSPTTLALMCDEQDTSFMTDDFPHHISSSNARTPMEQSSSMNGLSSLYAEQEKLVLTKLNCYFKELISRHWFKETKVEHKAGNDLCTNTFTDG
ncbi:protein tesmin/TSO1-like CXC 7 isoform X2 [Primulina eburnea]|uniref:protein tesmin/TSO1-like CXC 7 isoform X2 n=1 Tax=Primulina eburnea TaxID=1245227 RepID=UPI003C6C2F15